MKAVKSRDRIIFIDRDGVINVDPIGDYVKSWKKFRFESGALEGLKKLSNHGYEIIVISNQAGVGDGVYPESELTKIHDQMVNEFRKNRIRFKAAYYCLHGKEEGCSCRKPQTGLFKQAVQGLSFNLPETYFIGDKIADIEAGKRFGLKTVFVRTGHGRLQEAQIPRHLQPDLICDSLQQAAEVLTG